MHAGGKHSSLFVKGDSDEEKSLMTLTPDGSLEIQQLSFQFFEDFNKVDVKTEKIYDACIRNVIQFEEQNFGNLISAS